MERLGPPIGAMTAFARCHRASERRRTSLGVSSRPTLPAIRCAISATSSAHERRRTRSRGPRLAEDVAGPLTKTSVTPDRRQRLNGPKPNSSAHIASISDLRPAPCATRTVRRSVGARARRMRQESPGPMPTDLPRTRATSAGRSCDRAEQHIDCPQVGAVGEGMSARYAYRECREKWKRRARPRGRIVVARHMTRPTAHDARSGAATEHRLSWRSVPATNKGDRERQDRRRANRHRNEIDTAGVRPRMRPPDNDPLPSNVGGNEGAHRQERDSRHRETRSARAPGCTAVRDIRRGEASAGRGMGPTGPDR